MRPHSTHQYATRSALSTGNGKFTLILRSIVFLFFLSAYLLGNLWMTLPMVPREMGRETSADARPRYSVLRHGNHGSAAWSLRNRNMEETSAHVQSFEAASSDLKAPDGTENEALGRYMERSGNVVGIEAADTEMKALLAREESGVIKSQAQDEEGENLEELEENAVEDFGPIEEDGERSLFSSSSSSTSAPTSTSLSSIWPPPSWAWPLDPDHEAYGRDMFKIRFPPSAAASHATCTGAGSLDEDLDFTLVSQSSPDRIWMLPHICERWEGPIIVAIFMHGFTAEHDAFMANLKCPQLQCLPVHPSVPASSSIPASVWAAPNLYPVNALRNLAISEVRTTHFLLTDMDLWPSRRLYPLLKHLSSKREIDRRGTRETFLDPLQALVVPAFSYLGQVTGGEKQEAREDKVGGMPDDQRGLVECLWKGNCLVFDAQYNVHGHGTTDTAYWVGRQENEEIKPIPCFQSNRYEPYVVLRRCPTTPPFAEAFTGYGKNKIQHIAHLRFRGFTFSVLPPEAFLVHYPHPKSKSKQSWLEGGKQEASRGWRGRMDDLYSRFLDWAFNERAARAGSITHLCRPPESTALKA